MGKLGKIQKKNKKLKETLRVKQIKLNLSLFINFLWILILVLQLICGYG